MPMDTSTSTQDPAAAGDIEAHAGGSAAICETHAPTAGAWRRRPVAQHRWRRRGKLNPHLPLSVASQSHVRARCALTSAPDERTGAPFDEGAHPFGGIFTAH